MPRFKIESCQQTAAAISGLEPRNPISDYVTTIETEVVTPAKVINEVMYAIVDNYNYEHTASDGSYAVLFYDAVLFFSSDGSLLGGEDNFTAEEVQTGEENSEFDVQLDKNLQLAKVGEGWSCIEQAQGCVEEQGVDLSYFD